MSQNYGPKRFISINAQSADETLGKPAFAPGYALQTWVVQSNGVTSSGVITFEEASWGPSVTGVPAVDYTGTWSVITTVNASDVDTGSASGSAQKFIHISATANAYTRPRISTAIGGGGTVSVFLHEEGQ
jgi:hypothetical protein